MDKRIDTKSSRTAEWTCISRAASSLEQDANYHSDDTLALQILPQPIKTLIQNPFYRMLHCRFGIPKGMYEYVIARTKFMDEAYQLAVENGFDLIILLGAGYDTRAIRFHQQAGNPQVYEFDTPYTQQMKLHQYEANGISIPATIHFEAIDFGKESLQQRLQAIDFPEGKRCLFLMEGVSMYLEPDAMEATLQTVSRFMGDGSLFAFDYIHQDVLHLEKKHYGEREIMKSVSRVKEAWRFGIDQAKIGEYLAQFGLHTVRHLIAREMEAAYFSDEQGNTLARINDTHCLLLAEKGRQ